MRPEESRSRMQRMRAQVKEHNVYLWAGNLIGELAGIRLDAAKHGPAKGTHDGTRLVLPYKPASGRNMEVRVAYADMTAE